MLQETRIKVAAAVTAVFVGGLVTFGVASRNAASERGVAVVEASQPKPEVVHRRRVKTVHLTPQRSVSRGSRIEAAAPPVTSPAATPVVEDEEADDGAEYESDAD